MYLEGENLKRHRLLIILSFLLVPIIIGIYSVDLLGNFNFADKAFVIALLVYILFIFIQRSSSSVTFVLSLFF